MVVFGNIQSAWPVMDLAKMGKCSTWKYNTPNRFYQCRLLALQYDPCLDQIRYACLSRPSLSDKKDMLGTHLSLLASLSFVIIVLVITIINTIIVPATLLSLTAQLS